MARRLRATITGLLCLSIVAAAIAPSAAADYPNRPVRWLIGFAAGGPVDIVARIMSQWLSEHFGQQFVVENRTGSGGNHRRRRRDQFAAGRLYAAVRRAQQRDLDLALQEAAVRFHARHRAGREHHAAHQHAGGADAMPVKTVQEFIDYCKANPGKISYASSGNGTSVHMSAELFKAMTKCDMLHVPYRGSAIAFPDIISNKVQLIFDNLPSRARAGRAAAPCARSASPRRSAGRACRMFPRSPRPCRASKSVGFYGISAPKGTPPEIIEILNKAVGEALKDPKLVARLAEVGGMPKPMTPAEFGKLVADETEKWRKVVEFAGVSVD